MSLIDTAGRSGRFLTRAQNRAITIESAPRSSKKLLSTDTRSTLHDLSQHLSEDPLNRDRLNRDRSTGMGSTSPSAVARLLIVRCW